MSPGLSGSCSCISNPSPRRTWGNQPPHPLGSNLGESVLESTDGFGEDVTTTMHG